MIKTFFSFQGSLDKKEYLKTGLIIIAAGIVGGIVAGLLARMAGILGSLVYLAVCVACTWAWLAACVKRGNAIGIMWPWSVLLGLFLSLITFIIYLIIDKNPIEKK